MEGVLILGGFLIVFSFVFGFAAFRRFLIYKETIALAERGLLRPERTNKDGKDTLRWGIVITAVGLALCIGLYPLGFLGGMGSRFPLYFGPWMLLGLIPTFFGLGLILIYVLTREDKQPDTEAGVETVEE
jgi:hypothetical protein